MNEMVEKVARAIAAVVNKRHGYMDHKSPWTAHMDEARAAIEAIRDSGPMAALRQLYEAVEAQQDGLDPTVALVTAMRDAKSWIEPPVATQRD
jgi:hypothetical protein